MKIVLGLFLTLIGVGIGALVNYSTNSQIGLIFSFAFGLIGGHLIAMFFIERS